MEEMDITNETLDYDSVKTRSALRNILEKAKIETGFDTKRDKIYVQVFPSNDTVERCVQGVRSFFPNRTKTKKLI